MSQNGRRGRPMLMGDRVRLLGQVHGSFKDYAILGTVVSRGLAVVMLAEWDVELAPLFVYPATSLRWNAEEETWFGAAPPDRSQIVLAP